MIVVLDRRVNPIVAGLIALTLITSIVAAIDARNGGELYRRLALVPRAVWDGELWRLVTFVLVEGRPVALVLGCVTLFWFGGDLASVWGTRRFAWFVGAVVLGASVGTSVLGLVLQQAWWVPHLGGLTLGGALVVAWALQFPDRRIVVYQVLPVGGPVLAYGSVVLTALIAVFYGVAWVLPELLAGGGTLVYMTGTHRQLWRRFRRRKLDSFRGGRHGGPYAPN